MTDVKTIDGIAIEDVKDIQGITKSDVKSWGGNTIPSAGGPTPEFSGTPTSHELQVQAQTLNVSFTDESTGTPTYWRWCFTANYFDDFTWRGNWSASASYVAANLDIVYYDGVFYQCGNDVGPSETPPDEDLDNWDASQSPRFSDVQNPSYTYDEGEGSYDVWLLVGNSSGENAITKEGYITLTAPAAPTASFSGSPTSGASPLEVSFTNNSTGTLEIIQWDFGDGGSSEDSSPTYQYETPGTYTVSLHVENYSGMSDDIKTDYITVS